MNLALPPVPSAVRRRLDGSYRIDDWGLDPELVALLSPAIGLRWRVETQWAERLPVDGPAVLVYNRVLGLSEPFVVARSLRLATGRFVRSTGVPDIAPVGPLLRRLGGVLDRADEVGGLLRAGEVVALPLGRDRRSHRAGPIVTRTIAPALAAGVPVHPVGLVGHELGRTWRVLVGPAVTMPDGRGPLADVEFAEAARRGVQLLLDEAAPAPTVLSGFRADR